MNHTRHITVVLVALVTLVALSACAENEPPQRQLDPYEPATVEELECMPDLDGRIDADQLQPAFGIPINYRISPAGQVRHIDLAGHTDAAGTRIWDLSPVEGDYANDQNLKLVATEIDDKWYADDFPDAQFSTTLDPSLELDAVYSHDGQRLYLHGYVSQQEDPDAGLTRVAYQEPVVAYDFPLQEGDSWSGTGVVQDGRVRGLPYTGSETYEFEVDASGELWLPDITFTHILRVRTRITLESPIGNPIYREQVQFLFECFGEVARLVGPDRELIDGQFAPQDYTFDTAVEMRRLGF